MKILTKSQGDWQATLNVVPTESGRFGWEVELHDVRHQPPTQTVASGVDFKTSSVAAVDGLRALDAIHDASRAEVDGAQTWADGDNATASVAHAVPTGLAH